MPSFDGGRDPGEDVVSRGPHGLVRRTQSWDQNPGARASGEGLYLGPDGSSA